MMDQVDNISWNGGKHIYGPSDKIADYLKSLRSPSKMERDTALDYLVGTGQDIGTITSYTPLIIPFLFTFINDPHFPEKSGLLFSMGVMADGPYWSPDELNNIYISRTIILLRMGIPTYIELLKNTDAAVRSAAVFMLWHFPELSHKILVYLEEAFLTENDPFVRQEISIAIQRMQTQSRDF